MISCVAFNEEDFNSYTVGVQDVHLDNPTLQTVVKHLITWEDLSRYLELSDADEEEIKQNHPHNYKEQKYQCIKYWIKRNGKTATLINLLRKIYFKLEDKLSVMNIVDDIQRSSKLPWPAYIVYV